MSVPAAYAVVIIVWSTTPLGIQWSSETVPPVFAAMLRMSLSAVLGLLVLKWFAIPLPAHKQAWRVYGHSVMGVFGAMLLTYMAAPYVNSGMISILYGLAPIVSALLAQVLLDDRSFTRIRWLATAVALGGLVMIFWEDLQGNSPALKGIALVLTAVFLFSLSGVLVKREQHDLHPVATTVGTLWLSIPLYGIAALLLADQFQPDQWSLKSISAIIYLGLFGSLLGFVAYFYILQRLSPSSVTIITLITPVFAILLGVGLNGEYLHGYFAVGAALVLSGLGLFYWGDEWMAKAFEK